jgi:hypothetical protein
VHSLQPEALLWAGRSRTANPSNVSGLFREVANAAAGEVQRAGLIEGPK